MMADYTTPPWSQLVAGKPWTDEKAAAAFENPIAIMEGASGAPRLTYGALPRLAAGDVLRISQNATTAAASGVSYSVGLWLALLQSGWVRVSWQDSSSGVTAYSSLVRWRDDVAVTIASFTAGSSWASRVVDVSVLPGDVLEVRAMPSGSPANSTGYVRYCHISTSGAEVWSGGGGERFTVGPA